MKKFTPSARHGWANRADLSCIPDSARYNAVRVLHSLAGHANQETLITNVGIDKIAEEIAVSTRTVKRCLPRLEQAGLIVLKRIRRRGNVYMLLIGDMDEATKERVTDVFRSGKNLPQIAEFISDILLSLRDEQKSGSLSDTTPRSKCHHGVTLTGSREQGKEIPPYIPPPAGKAMPKPRKSKMTDPPDHFPITEDMAAWAADKGLSIDLQAETEIMLDWHRSEGRQRASWTATWRNWMTRAQRYADERANRSGGKKHGKHSVSDNIAAVVQQLGGEADHGHRGEDRRFQLIKGHG